MSERITSEGKEYRIGTDKSMERTEGNEDRGVTGAVSGEHEKNAGDRISGLS